MHSVLLVEDDLILQDLFPRALNRLDAEITLATDGLEALKLLESHYFDLMVTDINLPGLSGIDLMKHARMRLARENMKIVAVSANHVAIHNPVLKTLADKCLEKPVRNRVLLETCRDLLGQGDNEDNPKVFIRQTMPMNISSIPHE